MAKILITGATGFVGEHLAKALLQQGEEVTCLVRKTSRTAAIEAMGAKLAWGDVTDAASVAAAVDDKSVVYHVAGCVTATGRRELYRVNELGTRNVAQASADARRVPVLIVVSSLAAVGPSRDGCLRTESDRPAPVSEYGRSKLAGETAAREFADHVPVTVVRPPIVLGEGDLKGLDLFNSIARFGIHLVPGRTPSRFSIIHVSDLVRLLIVAAERGERLTTAGCNDSLARGCYFAACGEHPTYRELGRMVSEQLGRSARFVSIPLPLAWAVASGAEIAGRLRRRAFYFNFDKCREAAAGSWTCSPERAARELGFTVTTPLADRLRQTADWYREHGWL